MLDELVKVERNYEVKINIGETKVMKILNKGKMIKPYNTREKLGK